MQSPWRSAACWLAPQSLLSLLSCTLQNRLPSGGPSHSEWTVPSIVNQENARQTFSWFSFKGGIFLTKIPSFQICLGLCRGGKNHQHRGAALTCPSQELAVHWQKGQGPERLIERKLKFAENQRFLFPPPGNTWCFWLGVTMSLRLCNQVEQYT